ncbi:MAG: homoserine kinase [Desulforhopalus sp.]
MATYTTLDRKTVEELLEHYDVGDIVHFTPMEGGKANSSIVVTTKRGRFVLSVCDEKNSAEIGSLTSILEYLYKHDFPTTRIIRTRSTESLIEYDGKPVYLKEYIEGTVKEPLSSPMVQQVGACLARLHQIPPHADLLDFFSYGIESFDEVVDLKPPNDFSTWLATKAGFIKKGCGEDLPRGFIHGDLFSDNMLFSKDTLVAILDFEEACNYFLIFDIGMCAAGCCTVDGRFSQDLAAALISGYQSMRMLTPPEQQFLQLHIEYGAVATSFWRYRQYNIRYPNLGCRTLYKEMSELADQVRAIPQEVFFRNIFG